jgi:hypothetical protein
VSHSGCSSCPAARRASPLSSTDSLIRIGTHSRALISTGGQTPLLVISTAGHHPPSCHLDRRPKAAVERSGCERAVSGVCAKVHRPGQESFRPRGPSRYGATSDSRPDVSTPPRRAAALRAEVAPKKLIGRVPWLRWRSHASFESLTCLRKRKHGTQRGKSVSSRHQPRSGCATRHDRRRGRPHSGPPGRDRST